MMRAEKSNTGNSPRAGITASRVGAKDMPCADEAPTKGERTFGILLQQS